MCDIKQLQIKIRKCVKLITYKLKIFYMPYMKMFKDYY